METATAYPAKAFAKFLSPDRPKHASETQSGGPRLRLMGLFMKAFFVGLGAAILIATPAVAHEREVQSKLTPAVRQLPPQLKGTKPAQHSGGTDANGCHTNHSTGDYHCHKPR